MAGGAGDDDPQWHVPRAPLQQDVQSDPIALLVPEPRQDQASGVERLIGQLLDFHPVDILTPIVTPSSKRAIEANLYGA